MARRDSEIPQATQDGREVCAEDRLEDSWLLYLRPAHGNDDRHLFRVDLRAPADPPTDLTPLPPGSRVLTADPLATVPGAVLVTMDRRPGHVDYFLIDVGTGETTADLPGSAGDPRWTAEPPPDPPDRRFLGDGSR